VAFNALRHVAGRILLSTCRPMALLKPPSKTRRDVTRLDQLRCSFCIYTAKDECDEFSNEPRPFRGSDLVVIP